ncbi:glycosyltransferase [Microlunatus parietis]|uniref:GT2 family glycosyltransferase n=1 Tax=Microlunatus parietis TaxID=682979 RepID=A0A7Y9L8G9_9ACTN|nr:glycosyltransferase [Microlunatus parietis]NYE70754.1 GT2 family glycosyltransferase [Microlunatus parietis]
MARDIVPDDALEPRRSLGHAPASYELDLDPMIDTAQLSAITVGDGGEVDPWAWAREEDDYSRPVDVSRCEVTAVLVAFDAERWLSATLTGLSHLTVRPTRLIAIDNGSTDGTLDLLHDAMTRGILDAVYQGKRGTGFGEAVSRALAADAAAINEAADTRLFFTREEDQKEPWYWLLHDDAVPAPDALYQLLAHVVTDPDIDITGPKLLLPKRRQATRRLSEVGVSISGTGRRELSLDPGEIDQGQHDEPRPKLGVSSCGMLVRASAWSELGGLDPAVPVFRDGVEFGWRANLQGYRVVTSPAAEMVHRQVGRAGLRRRGIGGRRPGKTDRLLGMLVVVGHAPGAQVIWTWLRLVWSCILRSIGYLVGKAPGRSLDELLALGAFVANPSRIGRMRRRLAAIDPVSGAGDRVRELRPPWWSGFRLAGEALTGAVADRYQSVAGASEVALLDDLTADDFLTVGREEKSRSPWLAPIVIALVVAIGGSVLAARDLLRLGSLSGPALLPAQESLAAAWNAALAPIIGAASQSSPPWLVLVALGSTITFGQPEWFVTLLLCGVVPLSLLTGFLAVRHLIGDRRLRIWVAGTYALLPVLLGTTNQGRLGLAVIAVALPFLLLAVRALVLRRPRNPEAWRGGWGAGLVLVVLIAFEPSLLLFAIVLGIAGAIVLRRVPRKAGRILIALGVPLVVLAPWWPSLITSWGRVLVGPDAALTGVGDAARVWELMLGRPGGDGLPPIWISAIVFGLIWLLAAVGIARRPKSSTVVSAWVAGGLALAMAILVSRLVVNLPPIGDQARPWAGTYLLIAFAALLVAAGTGLDGWAAELGDRSFSWIQPASVLAGVLVGAITLGAAVWWAIAGAAGPIKRQPLDALPPYVVNAMASDGKVRVLAIDASGDGLRYSVVDETLARLGDADRGYAFGGSMGARSQSTDLVMRLVAGTGDSDIAPQLGRLGVGYVWVTGADEAEQALIGNTPGLGTASGNFRGMVWQVQPPPSRAVLVDGKKQTPIPVGGTTIEPGGENRRLEIGEPADWRWQATLDGIPLAAVDEGWQQAFLLPPQGGRLEYRLPTANWLLGLQGLALGVAAILAAPAIRRPEVRDPAKSARRAAAGGAGEV